MNTVHIGLMKTATTSVQNILSESRGRLKQQGFNYPGKGLNHQSEIYGLCGKDIYFKKKGAEKGDVRRASCFLKELSQINKCGESALISSEALSTLDHDGISRFVSHVGIPERVVITVRSIYKSIPSAWQQHVKEGNTVSYNDFMSSLDNNRKGLSGAWKTYAFGEIAKRWSNFCKDLNIVVVDDCDPSSLWPRFCSAAGILEYPADDVLSSSRSGNKSLSLEEAKFLLELNRYIEKNNPNDYLLKKKVVKYYLKKFVFSDSSYNISGGKILPLFCYRNKMAEWSRDECDILLGIRSANFYGEIKVLKEYSGEWSEDHDENVDNLYKIMAKRIGDFCLREVFK